MNKSEYTVFSRSWLYQHKKPELSLVDEVTFTICEDGVHAFEATVEWHADESSDFTTYPVFDVLDIRHEITPDHPFSKKFFSYLLAGNFNNVTVEEFVKFLEGAGFIDATQKGIA